MTTSKVTFSALDVINMALVKMREPRISSLEDDSHAGVVMRELYPMVRQACLTLTHWRFATAYASLSLLSGEPLTQFSAAWQLPADHLRTLNVEPPGNYEIHGNRVYTNNTSSCTICYLRYRPEGEWPAWFVQLVVRALVMEAREAVTGDKQADGDRIAYDSAHRYAASVDAQEQPNQMPASAPFVNVRYE